MYMYKLEITLEDRTVTMVVLADSDEKAFDYVEASLARHYIKSPAVKELVLIEKKRAEKGAAFILDPSAGA